MTVQKSHFPTPISIICVLAAVLVPTALALRGAWSLGARAMTEQSQENEIIKNQEIRAESRSLSDEILNEIELIKIRSIASVEMGGLPSDLNGGSIIAAAELTRGVFLPAFLKGELETEIPNISAKDIQNSGVSMFPVSIKTTEGGATLGVAFEQNNRKFLAIINPLVAFNGVTTWANGKEGELLRGYLVDSKGKVWVHSEKIYNGANFSDQALFQGAIGPTFRNQRVGGVGLYSGTRASYMRLRSLPYVVVAERVLRGGATLPSSAQRLNSLLRNLKKPLFSMLSVVALTCVGSVLLIFTSFGLVPKAHSHSVTTRNREVMDFFTAEQLRRAEEEFAVKTEEIESLRTSVIKSGSTVSTGEPS